MPHPTPFVAIVGAGDIGGATAQALAARESVREVRLIETRGGAGAGKALDLMQAAPIDGYATRIVAFGDLHAAAGAAAIVIADAFGPPSAEWQGEEGLALVRRLWELVERDRGVLVCAGSTQTALIHTAIRELHVDRKRIVGSAAAAFEAAARALTAVALDGAGSDVALMVVGAPPAAIVPCWSHATVKGAPLAGRLSAAAIAALDARLPALWPPAPYTLGAAAARAAEAIALGSRRDLTTFVALDGEMRMRGTVAALPVRLGPEGVVRIVEPELSTHERVRFENAR